MTMKMSKLALAIGALVMAGGAMAQSTETGTGTANATVIAPIAITAGATLEFGKVVAGSGLVTIDTDGNRTDSGGWAASAQKGTVRNATFTVAGQPGFTYSITFPVSFSVTASGGATMLAEIFTVAQGTNGTVAGTNNPLTGTGAVGTLSATTGTGDLKVGATLNISTNQVAGDYTGNYSVIVAYN